MLLRKEALYQAIRFILAGSFSSEEPIVTELLQQVHHVCPTLLDSLLPYSEKSEQADTQDATRMTALSDHQYQSPAGLNRLPQVYVTNVLQQVVIPGHLHFSHPFHRMLRHAYSRDYNMANVSIPERKKVQWCQKLAFTDL